MTYSSFTPWSGWTLLGHTAHRTPTWNCCSWHNKHCSLFRSLSTTTVAHSSPVPSQLQFYLDFSESPSTILLIVAKSIIIKISLQSTVIMRMTNKIKYGNFLLPFIAGSNSLTENIWIGQILNGNREIKQTEISICVSVWAVNLLPILTLQHFVWTRFSTLLDCLLTR